MSPDNHRHLVGSSASNRKPIVVEFIERKSSATFKSDIIWLRTSLI